MRRTRSTKHQAKQCNSFILICLCHAWLHISVVAGFTPARDTNEWSSVSKAIGSTIPNFTINGLYKPSTYRWFTIALLTLTWKLKRERQRLLPYIFWFLGIAHGSWSAYVQVTLIMMIEYLALANTVFICLAGYLVYVCIYICIYIYYGVREAGI